MNHYKLLDNELILPHNAQKMQKSSKPKLPYESAKKKRKPDWSNEREKKRNWE